MADHAAPVLLERRLLCRRSTGTPIDSGWTRLRYSAYWYYDVLTVLTALKGLAEAGLIGDARCQEGLDLLEARQSPEGGWAAEVKHYRVTEAAGSGVEHVG